MPRPGLIAAGACLWGLGVGCWDLEVARAHNPVSTTVTWAREIAPLFERRCVSCHHAGGFSGVPLTTYDDVRPWAVAIKEVVLAGEMPPWGAAAGIGQFANDPRLTRHEMELVAAWVDGGAPYALHARTPAFLAATSGTEPAPLRTAAFIPVTDGLAIPLAPAAIESALDRVASVTLQLPATMTLAAWSFDPGRAPSVAQVDLEVGSRWVGTWTPGDGRIEFPSDAGAVLTDSALFTARISYRAPAARTIDHSRLRVWLVKEARPKTIREVTVVRAWRAAEGVELLAVRPARGADAAHIVAQYPNGRADAIAALSQPAHGAHPTYRLARALPLPPGAVIATTAPVRLLYAASATRSVNSNVRRRPRR